MQSRERAEFCRFFRPLSVEESSERTGGILGKVFNGLNILAAIAIFAAGTTRLFSVPYGFGETGVDLFMMYVLVLLLPVCFLFLFIS
jgi:hypothetical protein